MSTLKAIVYREAMIRATNLTFVFWDLAYPLCYMLVFGVGVNAALEMPVNVPGMDYNAFFLGGVLAMASFGIAANTSWSFFLDRDNGIFFEMLTYPISRAEYLLGKVLVNVFIALLQAAIALGLGWLLFDIRLTWSRVPLTFLGMAVGTAGWFFFYSIFALKTRRNDVFNSITSIFYFVFLFASSMFYPLEPLPAWLRTTASLNPITWQIDWFRYTSIGLGNAQTVLWQGVAFVAFSAVAFAYAVKLLQKQE
ncbi:MAG TPA: ABC transporter permease [Terriglobales bacterium]|nr:ABC transporter permease [Terriglobales bacterium]